MVNNQNITDYYNSRISDLRKKVYRGIIPRSDRDKVLRYLNQLSEKVDNSYTTKQFNEMLDKIDKLYNKLQGEFDFKINSLNLYFKKHKSFPVYSDKITTFKDGTIMSEFILENLNYLEKLYSKSKVLIYNLKDYKLAKKRPVLISNKPWPFQIKIRFVFKYLSEYCCLPMEYDNDFKFPDGELVSNWFKQNNCDLRKSTDYRAKVILSYYDYYIDQDFQNKLDEAYGYLSQNGELPRISDRKIKFSDGTLMGSWVYHNIEKIKQLKNFVRKAKTMSEYLSFVKDKGIYNIIFYSQMLEVFNYLKENKKLPAYDDTTIKLKNGTLMGKWIIHNRKKIQELDNDYALVISNYLEMHKLKRELRRKNLLTVDERITAVYEYLVEHGCLPKYNDTTVMFSDSVIMGRWISQNKKRIKSMAQDNRTIAIVQYLDSLKLSKDDSSKCMMAVFERQSVNKEKEKVKKLNIK